MHAALPYLCPSNYPTLATPLPWFIAPLCTTQCLVHIYLYYNLMTSTNGITVVGYSLTLIHCLVVHDSTEHLGILSTLQTDALLNVVNSLSNMDASF